ncbi:MAG: hypothetical protein P8Y85_07135, partial [Nitrospirota bacterium]
MRKKDQSQTDWGSDIRFFVLSKNPHAVHMHFAFPSASKSSVAKMQLSSFAPGYSKASKNLSYATIGTVKVM